MIWRLQYAWLCARRLPVAWLFNPVYVTRIAGVRLLYLLTRRFCGPSFVSPITGERIFNIQSLINAFAMQVVGELDGPWMEHVRETPSPVIWDVGANIGQFAALARSLNPGALICTFDPWPEMVDYLPPYARLARHMPVALGAREEALTLTKARIGWTASSAPDYYDGAKITVPVRTLDNIWEEAGRPDVDVLKIDVDGAEAAVLAGATAMLEHTKFVLVETVEPEKLEPARRWTSANAFDYCGKLSPLC